jgi:ATP-dependent helicase/nuclease subunit A
MMEQKKSSSTPEQRNATNPEKSVWVTANAGSGKTHVLVERVIRLLLEGAEPAAILCITFTKAAASEMSQRLFARLSRWTIIKDDALQDDLLQLGITLPDGDQLTKARRLFARALETPGGLKIQTIHAFCEKLLQQFPVEAGMSPGFSILGERQSKELLSASIDEILRIAEAGKDPDLTTAFTSIVGYLGKESFENLVLQFLSNGKGLRHVVNSELTKNQYEIILKTAFGIFEDETSAILKNELCTIGRSDYQFHGDILANYKVHGKHDSSSLMKAIATSGPTLERLKNLFLTGENTLRKSLLAVATIRENPLTAEFIDVEKFRFVALLEKHDLLVRIEATSNLFVIAQAIHKRMERHKKYSAVYDFDDLIYRTANLLNSLRATQWVLYKLDAGLKHILVDEAQDTSPAQWQIISALTEEFFSGAGSPQKIERTLFVVGDQKQSIYSFQGADIRAFVAAQKQLSQRIEDADKILDKVDLTISYRSTPEILAAVDTVFPPENLARFGFAVNEASVSPHQSNRLRHKGLFELWPLISADQDKIEDEPWNAPVDSESKQSSRHLLARKIAQTIKSWIGHRIIESRNRAVQPDDILILFQSRNILFSILIAELRKAGVPVAGADRLQLLESLVIQDLLMLVQWLLLPQDDYALACILKSPLLPFPLDDKQLMELAIGRGTATLWEQIKSQEDKNKLRLLELQNNFEKMGPYAFYASVMVKSRHDIVKRLGSEAVDASDAFLDQAMAFELEFGQSLAGFLHWFRANETSVKREMERSTGEVRLMTVHGAKGLEANIVFLADAAAVPRGGRSEPALLPIPQGVAGAGLPLWSLPNLTTTSSLQIWKDHQKLKSVAEHNRLLYVAMTRACDELYVCGAKPAKNLPEDSWYAIIEAAVGSSPMPSDRSEIATAEVTQPKPIPRDESLSWIKTAAKVESGESIFSLTGLVSRFRAHDKVFDPSVMSRGVAIHSLLQELPSIKIELRDSFARNRAKRLGLDDAEVTRLLHVINSAEFSVFYGPESHAEAELRGKLEDGREVSGRVDRLVIGTTEIYVLDYKSDRNPPENLAAEHPYVFQMALYAQLLQEAYPQHLVKAAVLWTQTGKLMWLAPDFLTQSRVLALGELELEAP